MVSSPSLVGELPGTERFEVLGLIGSGGMGVVYEAFDRRQGNRVALKVLKHLEPAALLRFKQEFRALADVNHPNLVGLRELVHEGGRWLVAMELIDGVDFMRWVRPGHVTRQAETLTSDPGQPEGETSASSVPAATLDVDRLRAALHQLGTGVAALHALGKLHCDLKPANVLVTRSGRVVLLDFGLVTELEDDGRSRASDTVAGTAGYMAPEQGESSPLTEASDWYAVGSMLYEALTGRRPFLGGGLQMLMARSTTDPTPPSRVAADVPEDLEALCMELLRREPLSRPSGTEVLRRLGARHDVAHTRAGSMPLVGRGREWGVLEAALASATRGKPVCVVVRGRSGMGKSTLVRRFLNDVGDRAVVLAGRCYERESVPYKALDSVVDALCRHLLRLPAEESKQLVPRDAAALVRVFPVLRRVGALARARVPAEVPDATELRRRAFAALRELLVQLARRRPLVLFIDDLQWGDADSAVLLTELLAPPDPPALLLVCCRRSGDTAPPGPLIATLLASREGGIETHELTLDALSDAEARMLARSLLGDGDGDSVDDVALRERCELAAREAQGSPFLLVQLAQHLASGAGLAGGGAVSFEDLVRARMARLSERARHLLELVAVAGRPLGKATARDAAELDSLDEALAPLCAGQLLLTSRAHGHDTIECYHDRIRETVASLLAPEVAAAHHARIARTLEASGAGAEDPEALALHYEAAGERERAGTWVQAAAERAAAALAFDHAALLYRRALAWQAADDDQRRELHARLAAVLADAGRGHEAAQAYLAAASGAPPALAFERRQYAAQQLLRSGFLDQGEAVLAEVLAQVGVSTPRSHRRLLAGLGWSRLRIWARGYQFRERDVSELRADELVHVDTLWGASTGMGMVDYLQTVYYHQLHLLAALRLGEPRRISLALGMEATTLVAGARAGPARRAARMLAEARALALRTGDDRAIASAPLMSGLTDLQLCRWERALRSFDDAAVLLRERCSNVAWELSTALLLGGLALSYLGRLDELQRRLPAILRHGQEHGDLYLSTTAPSLLHLVWLATDDAAGLRDTIRSAMAHWSQRGYNVQHQAALTAQVGADLYEGQAEAALQRAQDDWPRLGLLTKSALAVHTALSVMGRAALGAASSPARRATSLRVALDCARKLERDREAPYAIAHAWLLRGGNAVVTGDASAAVAHYASAEAAFAALDMVTHVAAVKRRRGQVLGGDAGAALVAEADAVLTEQRVRRPERFAAMLAPAPPLD
jgi:hypothetical protein